MGQNRGDRECAIELSQQIPKAMGEKFSIGHIGGKRRRGIVKGTGGPYRSSGVFNRGIYNCSVKKYPSYLLLFWGVSSPFSVFRFKECVNHADYRLFQLFVKCVFCEQLHRVCVPMRSYFGLSTMRFFLRVP